MLWWKQLECVQNNVIMIEQEEQRKDYVDNTTVTLTLPTRDPVLQDNLLIANIDQVKTLQASLFPICNKGDDFDIINHSECYFITNSANVFKILDRLVTWLNKSYFYFQEHSFQTFFTTTLKQIY